MTKSRLLTHTCTITRFIQTRTQFTIPTDVLAYLIQFQFVFRSVNIFNVCPVSTYFLVKIKVFSVRKSASASARYQVYMENPISWRIISESTFYMYRYVLYSVEVRPIYRVLWTKEIFRGSSFVGEEAKARGRAGIVMCVSRRRLSSAAVGITRAEDGDPFSNALHPVSLELKNNFIPSSTFTLQLLCLYLPSTLHPI